MPATSPATSFFHDLRRAVSWHRRTVVAALAAASVLLGLTALSPAPPPTESVLTASDDLPAGSQLTVDKLSITEVPPEVVPAGALRAEGDVRGVVAGPIAKGEIVSESRLLGPGLLTRLGEDLVAAPVRIADEGSVALLRGGDEVDIFAARTDASGADDSAVAVATAVRVVSVPDVEESAGGSGGGLVVLATTREAAARLAQAQVGTRLSIVLRR